MHMAQAGVAGAEIIEREAAAEALEIMRHGGGAIQIVKQGALGELERQAMQRKLKFAGQTLDAARHVRIKQLPG